MALIESSQVGRKRQHAQNGCVGYDAVFRAKRLENSSFAHFPGMEEEDAALRREAEALERVLFRLASAPDERAASVVRALLPQLLRLFPSALATPAQLLLKDKVRLRRSRVEFRAGADS